MADLLSMLSIDRRIAVWQKGHPIEGYDPAIWRRDDFGNAIKFSEYGNQQSEYGWQIDHIRPSALGGADGLDNLRPLHYRQNASLGGQLANLLKPK